MLRRSFLCALAVNPVRVATFQAEVTPTIGTPIYTGTARSIVDPLEARGLVVHGGGKPVVICSLDWCEIRNRSYDQWRETLAAAAGTTRERVLLSCVHQHDAPYTDMDAQRLLDEVRSPDRLCDVAFERASMDTVASSIRAAPLQVVTHIGTGEARAEKVASNRRYVRPDGKISFGRTSATRDPAIRDMPEGLIDPMLKTVGFWNGSKPVAALHAYSTHPMSYYGQGNVSADFIGIARRRIQSEDRDTFHIYLSGASGDTMAGRYNDGNPANRPVLAGRVYDAMAAAWRSTRREPLRRIGFRNGNLIFRPRSTRGFSEAEMRALMQAPGTPRRERLDAALGISWLQRLARRQPIDVPALHLGPAVLVLVPAEAFVQYQLWAQQASPSRFVMTAGYSDCAPGYIPTSAAVSKGYDDHYSWVDFNTCEAAMRTAIRQALR
ncbi:MAG: hypothetical protein HY820_19495 [Acidobacteria bacterium]|nr:hypothetical protein [Acidobacteriota bacterium]